MRLSSFVAPLACLAAVADAALTTVEFDLVYPRDNTSYAPTPKMPVIFAVKNPVVAREMYPYLWVKVQGADGHIGNQIAISNGTWWGDWKANETSFVYSYLDGFVEEGGRALFFGLYWNRCGVQRNGSLNGDISTNSSATTSFLFEIAKGGQPVDLLAVDYSPAKCGLGAGHLLTVDDELKPLSAAASARFGASQCLVVPPLASELLDDLTFGQCDIRFPAAFAANISATLNQTACGNSTACPSAATGATATNTPQTSSTVAADPSKNAADRLAMAGTACLTAAFGVFGFLLA
jgi:hypothetical protein